MLREPYAPNQNDMRVLVTGGAGYIGSHAARALSKHGHSVVILDNLSSGLRAFAEGFPLVVADLGNPKELPNVLSEVDAVMHFAAHAYVGESVENPRKYFDNNVRGGLALLNAMLDAHVGNIVFSSTCALYGIPNVVPIGEDTVRNPINPYGTSKLFLEKALEAYSVAYGMRSVSLRYFNAAGADDSGEIGEAHDPETHLIPRVLLAAAGKLDHLEIFGSDYPTPDGTCIRDYVHVSDLAEAHVLALEYLEGGGLSTALNLGTGTGHSNLEVVRMVEKITGKRVPLRMVPRRAGDPPVLVADPAKAKQVLGWTASRSLSDIVSSAWKWMQSSSSRNVVPK
ncbi:MAG TPA: UDP-glucose 4-epimerase GalE [Terriglobales bacterium]|nr:UDP-glucose 4-epimerase GalE [Terriglobales bacterium]